MADTQALAKAMADGGDESGVRKSIFKQDPDWERTEITKPYASGLRKLYPDSEAKAKMNFNVAKIREQLSQNPMLLVHLFEVFKIPCKRDSAGKGVSMLAGQTYDWTLTLFYDCLREDSSFFTDIEAAFKNGMMGTPLVSFVTNEEVMEEYTVGKAAWLLTCLISNIPHRFSDEEVRLTLKAITNDSNKAFTKYAKLEALSNLLKCNSLRKQVWQEPGVSSLIFSVMPNDSSQTVYRFVFNVWMLSFEEDITLKGSTSLKSLGVVMMLKRILAQSRTEKVIRLSLVVLRNLLKNKEIAIELVEAEVLDVVQQLEYEKWRDAELYEAIREVAGLIATEQSECSNFDTYTRELAKGKLSWGFIHTYKFWAENYKNFEAGNFSEVKKLAALLNTGDPDTLAVACHDIGEFVSLHPSGKRVIAELQVKENVMMLMQKEGETYRQVRREALLCCQKIMLNKWQDAAAGKSA